MTQTHWNIIFVVLFAVLITLFGFNSCNKEAETDNSRLEQLIEGLKHQADSLNKITIDSMTAISKRDSIHNVNITNIFNNATKEKKEVITKPVTTKRIIDLKRVLDSIYQSNR